MAEPLAPLGISFETWCTEDDLPQSRLEDVTDVDVGRCIQAATELLYLLTARQYGIGRARVRPTPIAGSYGTQSYLYPYSSMSGYGAAWGFAAGWSWTAVGMGWWQNGQDLSELVLQGPVRRINQVMVDGQILPPSGYTLYDGRRLLRNLDITGQGTSAWPWNQNLQLPLSEPGTWMVDYEWGREPGHLGWMAAVELSIQFALAMSGSDQSVLDARVTSMAVEGVNVQVGNSVNSIKDSLTSIPVVDMFLVAVNPTGQRRRTIIVSPNTVQGRSLPS